MKMTRFVALLALVAFPALGLAQTTTAEPEKQAATKPASKPVPADAADAADSPLVRAAKQARAKKKPGGVVIDNDDVKKAKGNLILVTEKPIDPDLVKMVGDQNKKKGPSVADQLAAATVKLNAAQKTVDELEKELARLEDEYYNEDDPNQRGDVIERRFNQAAKQLEQARRDLLDAREEQQRLQAQAATRRSDQ